MLAKKKYSFTAALLISHCGRVGRKEMRRRSSRERTQRQFFQPTFTTKDNKTGEDKKNEELFLPTSDEAINKDKKKSRLKVRSIYDYEDDDDDDDDDGDGDGGDNEEEDEEDDLVGKIKMRKTKKDKGVKNDEYYVDVDSLKVSPDRKEYLRKVFKRDSKKSCIEDILQKRKRSGKVPDLRKLSSSSSSQKKNKNKKFGQSLSIHEIRALDRKLKPTLEESFARNI